jgi:hypothetical protein
MTSPTSAPEPDVDSRADTHFDCVQARRTDVEGEQLLEEALARLRARRTNAVPRLIIGF